MEVKVRDIPEMYSELMIMMNIHGRQEDSRNGDVMTVQRPVMVTVHNPLHRVNMDKLRRCNPFFHVMEFVWMMAGENDVEWLLQFNKGMEQYAEDGVLHGAYGYRWHHHFGVSQLYDIIDLLGHSPETRRAVLTMWDPRTDLEHHLDLPCNTHIYLRIVAGRLDMTVCNRSNDVIWGMTGANAVHMTFLQELIANALNIPVGYYTVFTNNAHVYLDLTNVRAMLRTTGSFGPDKTNEKHVPVLQEGENLAQFFYECREFISNPLCVLTNNWLSTVARPMEQLWFDRSSPNFVEDSNWYQACNQWLQKK